MTELKTTLTVNAAPIELNDFTGKFLTQTVMAAVSTLKKVGEITDLEVSITSARTAVTVNGHKIPLGPFPSRIIASTLSGLVSALKSVDTNFESCNIKVG